MEPKTLWIIKTIIISGVFILVGILHTDFCRKGEKKGKWFTRTIILLLIIQAVFTNLAT